ncbi:SMI1/KNR4 family protein [Mucilaginibacter sp. RS28]|uniref:SMI1/KNR4 family protein n=1 Tax=Mucilaginibacter straminoryzae TaxID=2932774 RepID=A0A9X1X351_9SPHI|nr:SMI1/KNR4 family protein [Mucilaginibacter straminoryzae]MCJ8210337.1 SMI1/KNR4 family protein [Mucilaginibacter straminoryzae]
MNTITESFSAILKKQKELNYYFPSILRPPAAPTDITKTEDKLGLNFNDELKELYLFADGTSIDNITPCGKTGLIPIHNFLSLKDAINYHEQSMKFDDSFYNWAKDFKPCKQLFPFLEDGAGNCYWVDLNEGTAKYGNIFWTNTFGADPDYIYSSLTSMFGVIADAYETRIMFVDKDGYLDCDFDAFDELSKGK